MLSFVARRLAALIPVLLVVSLVVFLILRLAPGDPAAVIAGNTATAQDIAKIRTELGLERSWPEQYGIWLWRLAQGDLGHSYYLNKPVSGLIAERIGPTLSLALGSALLAVLLAVPLGTLAAWRMGSPLDRCISGFSVIGYSVPAFVIGYVLIYLFAIQWPWLPVQGYKPLWGPSSQGVWGWMRQLILPWVALGLIYTGLIARVTRASVSESLTEDHIRTARAKGLSELRVLLRHALAHAAVPIVTVIGIGVALLIGGVVVTETVFAIPGLGSLTVDAVLNATSPSSRDWCCFFRSVMCGSICAWTSATCGSTHASGTEP